MRIRNREAYDKAQLKKARQLKRLVERVTQRIIKKLASDHDGQLADISIHAAARQLQVAVCYDISSYSVERYHDLSLEDLIVKALRVAKSSGALVVEESHTSYRVISPVSSRITEKDLSASDDEQPDVLPALTGRQLAQLRRWEGIRVPV